MSPGLLPYILPAATLSLCTVSVGLTVAVAVTGLSSVFARAVKAAPITVPKTGFEPVRIFARVRKPSDGFDGLISVPSISILLLKVY